MTRSEVQESQPSPLLPWNVRPGRDPRKWRDSLPEVQVTVGRDPRSSGVTISAWLPTLGEYATYKTLYANRWNNPIASTEEALRIALKAIQACIAEFEAQAESD